MNRFRAVFLRLIVLALLAIGLTPTVYARPPRDKLEHAILSTVYIITPDADGNPYVSGSGSIVDPRGLILTNFHVVADVDTGTYYNPKRLAVIAVTRNLRQAAVPVFFAQVMKGDSSLDLALLQVVADIKGNDLTGCLTLPNYDLGDSDTLNPGDPLTVIGFPGLGGQTYTVTEGDVSGFDVDTSGLVTMIKTAAEINHGNSGGSAIDDNGLLVGVPTSAYTDQAGKISRVRPINLASKILQNLAAASVPGCGGKSGGNTAKPDSGSLHQPAINFTGFTLKQDAQNTVRQAPTGTQALYGNFTYTGIDAKTPLIYRWLLNDRALADGADQSDTWPLDPGDGDGYISYSNKKGLADGTYTLQVQAGDLPAITGSIVVGGGNGTSNDATTVKLTGHVFSADSDDSLSGALFVILAPGITWDTVDLKNKQQVYDAVSTDSEGIFETNKALALDTPYSVGVFAKGYQPIEKDGFVLRKYYKSGNAIDLGDIGLKSQ